MSFAGSTTTFTGNITLPVGSLPANRISGTSLTLSGNQLLHPNKFLMEI
jgi:hypothetical protein